MIQTIEIGNQAEDRALNYLQEQGLILIERNFRCRMGEIDLIMLDGKTLVFVEVRYRKNNAFGGPIVSISQTKQNKLRIAAKLYMQQNPPAAKKPARFDVMGIFGSDNSVEWLQNAIEDSA